MPIQRWLDGASLTVAGARPRDLKALLPDGSQALTLAQLLRQAGCPGNCSVKPHDSERQTASAVEVRQCYEDNESAGCSERHTTSVRKTH